MRLEGTEPSSPVSYILQSVGGSCLSSLRLGGDTRGLTQASLGYKVKFQIRLYCQVNLISYEQMNKQTKDMWKSRGAVSTAHEGQVSLRDCKGKWQCSLWLSLIPDHVQECVLHCNNSRWLQCEFRVGWSRKKRCEMMGTFYMNHFGTIVEKFMEKTKWGPLRSILQLPGRKKWHLQLEMEQFMGWN